MFVWDVRSDDHERIMDANASPSRLSNYPVLPTISDFFFSLILLLLFVPGAFGEGARAPEHTRI